MRPLATLALGVLLLGACRDEDTAPTEVRLLPPAAGHLVPPTPVDLGALGPAQLQSAATGINDASQVVGWSQTLGGFIHPFLWEPNNGMKDLGSPDGNNARATAINDIGRIVGYTEDPAPRFLPWVWDRGTFIMLPVPDGMSGAATAIAPGNEGLVAGCVWTTETRFTPIAVTWDPAAGTRYAIDMIGNQRPGTVYSACATGVDAARRVTAGGNDGAVWRNGAWFALRREDGDLHYPAEAWGLEPTGTGKAVGYNPSWETALYWPALDASNAVGFDGPACAAGNYFGGAGSAVNRRAEVVGGIRCYISEDKATRKVAFFWTPEIAAVELPSFMPFTSGGSAWATAINTIDQAVGTSTVAPGVSHATLWGIVPEVTVLQLPLCSPRPCDIPPVVAYLPERFINDGILSRPGFDATRLDPASITLGDGTGRRVPVHRDAGGAWVTAREDVDGDGDEDLVVSFSTTDLIREEVLRPDTHTLEVSALQPSGAPWTGRYPVTVEK